MEEGMFVMNWNKEKAVGMNYLICSGVGAVLGSIVYQAVAHGISEIDGYRSLFVGVCTMLLYGLWIGFKHRLAKKVPKGTQHL